MDRRRASGGGPGARRRDAALSPTLGLLVSLSAFLLAFSTMTSVLEERAGPAAAGTPRAHLQQKADEILDIVVREPGRTDTGMVAWHTDPDKLGRFGLAEAGRPNFLDEPKVRNLSKGGLTLDAANALPDYEEVRAALGLSADYDFHLRAFPLLDSLASGRFVPYRLSTAYVGAFAAGSATSGATVLVDQSLAASDHTLVTVNVTSDSNVTLTYQVSLRLSIDGDDVLDDQSSVVLDPGAATNVTLKIHDVDWDNDCTDDDDDDCTLRVKLIDALSATVYDQTSRLNVTEGSHPFNLIVDAGATYYEPADRVRVYSDDFDGNGDRRNDGPGNHGMYARLVILYPNGTEWVNETVDVPKNNKAQKDYDLPANAPTGKYVMRLSNGSVVAEDLFTVTTAAIGASTYAEEAVSLAERGFIDSLIDDAYFNNVTHDDATAAQGHVYKDIEGDTRDLAANISDYRIVIVGSNTKQNAFVPSAVKTPIKDWVLAGGTLIVFGSQTSTTQWLEPLFNAGLKTGSGGLSAPDPSHPLLHTPEELKYRSYKDFGFVWQIDTNDGSFTHVLQKSTSKTTSDDMLAVSDPGAFGNGTVILAAFVPGDLANPPSPEEARRFLHNLISFSYSLLYIDFGPQVPDEAQVVTAARIVAVPNPINTDPYIRLRLVMYVFQ